LQPAYQCFELYCIRKFICNYNTFGFAGRGEEEIVGMVIFAIMQKNNKADFPDQRGNGVRRELLKISIRHSGMLEGQSTGRICLQGCKAV
jgi:hypothetical protein